MSVFISCRWSWRWLWIYDMRSYMGDYVGMHALALLLSPRINPDALLCLCMPFHAQTTCLCTRSSLFASEFYCHSNHLFTSGPTVWLLVCSFVPAAGLHSLPQAFPAISCSLSCMAHCWTTAGTEHFITVACREKQRQTGEWTQGSRRPLLGWDIP